MNHQQWLEFGFSKKFSHQIQTEFCLTNAQIENLKNQAQALLSKRDLNSFFSQLNQLTIPKISHHKLDSQYVEIGQKKDVTISFIKEIDSILESLKPWRKGPFKLFETIDLDCEWDSHQKWQRLKEHLPSLKQKTILDIGSNSGYYLFRIANHQPKLVLGLDPYPLYFQQFCLLHQLEKIDSIGYLPLGFQQLDFLKQCFDVIFCMGILYHQKDPLGALKTTKNLLKKKGTLILETLIWPGAEPFCFCPPKRYAGMRNVYFLPTLSCLLGWLKRAGFQNTEVINQNQTTFLEQRQTKWMENFSLKDFLDPSDPAKTKEGYPAPLRVIILAR